MTIDWWELCKTLSGFIGAGTGTLALYLNRSDARRSRMAAEPRATFLFNPHAEDGDWYVIKLTFDNIRQSLILTSAEILKPNSAIIAARKKSEGGSQIRDEAKKGKKIAVKWSVNPPVDGKSAAGFAHLCLRLPANVTPTSVSLKLQGHYIAGMQEAVVIRTHGRVGLG
ncbi:hypothetical protein [Tardiphaga sp.]|uniref:hypothetical protein n=1 Tax=Tardiphaga sp. TaxID=1926292 RepID=UPI00262D91EC|nr:hypothetical protein [Tardiphaga sp.]